MAALGLIFGLLLIVALGRTRGIDPDKLWNLGIVAILSGVAGSKLLMLVVDFSYYSEHPSRDFCAFDAASRWRLVGRTGPGDCDVRLVHAA